MLNNGLPRYPWKTWFASKTFTIKQGTDYHCQTHSMVAQIRARASKAKKRVSVNVTTDKKGKATIKVAQQ